MALGLLLLLFSLFYAFLFIQVLEAHEGITQNVFPPVVVVYLVITLRNHFSSCGSATLVASRGRRDVKSTFFYYKAVL